MSPQLKNNMHHTRRYWGYRTFSWLFLALSVLLFIATLLLLLLQFYVLPQTKELFNEVANEVYAKHAIRIDAKKVNTSLVGFNPHLFVHGLTLRITPHTKPIHIETIKAEIEWDILFQRGLSLRRLLIDGLQISLTRNRQGEIAWTDSANNPSNNNTLKKSIDDDLSDTQSSSLLLSALPSQDLLSSETLSDKNETTVMEVLDWVMNQPAISIRNASVYWYDKRFHTPTKNWHILTQLLIEKQASVTSILAKFTPPTNVAESIRLDGRFKNFSAIDWRNNQGEASLTLKQANLTELSYFLPENQRFFGKGDFTLWMKGEGLTDTRLAISLTTQDLRWAKLPWKVRSANGEILARLKKGVMHIDSRHFILRTSEGRFPLPTRTDIQLSPALLNPLNSTTHETWPFEKVDLFIPIIQLSEIQRMMFKSLIRAIPQAQKFESIDLTGKLLDNRVTLQLSKQPEKQTPSWQIKSRLEDVGWAAVENIPGLSNISAQLHLTPSFGNLHFDTKHLEVNAPNIMHQAKHAFSKLTGALSWEYTAADDYRLLFKNINFSNADGKVRLEGTFHQRGLIPSINIYATLSDAQARNTWRYMPTVSNKEVVQWLKHSIIEGAAPFTTLILRGDMRQFPFRKTPLVPKEHENIFQIHVPFHNAQLKFDPSWPAVKKATGLLTFNGPSMDIFVTRGFLSGAKAQGTQISISNLEIPNLQINGTIQGTPDQFKAFMLNSPLANSIPRMAEAQAAGSTHLKLQLSLPLENNSNAYQVKGLVKSKLSTLSISPQLPSLEALNITTQFDQEGLISIEGEGLLLGVPIAFKPTDKRALTYIALPNIYDSTLKQWLPNHPLLNTLQGEASATGTLELSLQKIALTLDVDTKGIASHLPAPFNKPIGVNWPLALKIENHPPTSQSAQFDTPQLDQERWFMRTTLSNESAYTTASNQILQAIGQWSGLNAKISIDIGHHQPSPPHLSNIVPPDILSHFQSTPSSKSGIGLTIHLEELVVDPWISHLRQWVSHNTSKNIPINYVNSHVQRLSLFQQEWKNASIALTPQDHDWKINIESPQAAGTIVLSTRHQQSTLKANFQHLTLSIPSSNDQASKVSQPYTPQTPASELPGIEIHIQKLSLPSSSKLGEFQLQGEPTESGYQLTSFQLKEGPHILKGKGMSYDNTQKSQITFQLNSPNLSDLLSSHLSNAYLSKTELNAQAILEWEGNMLDFSIKNLMGELDLTMKNGSFLEVDPGVGRLFALLSLQTIFRRIAFDFSDSLNKGFSFDKITSKLKIHQTQLSTKNTLINASAAQILMYGSIHLGDETQDMELIVLPSVSSTLSSGLTFFVNPVTGIISWLTQKIIGNPLDHVFAKKLKVTGTWENPQVKEVSYDPLKEPHFQKQSKVDSSKESLPLSQQKSAILPSLDSSEKNDVIKAFNRLRPIDFRAECR